MKELDTLKLHKDTESLYRGVLVNGDTLHPEAPPLYATTAFMMKDVDQQQQVLANRGYNYIRGTNPTRDALGELISCLEYGEKPYCSVQAWALLQLLYLLF